MPLIWPLMLRARPRPLVLQRILGHSDIRVTMRYAHFAPYHLEDAIHCNPLAIMAGKSGGKMAAKWRRRLSQGRTRCNRMGNNSLIN
ncbi:hypothetical protein F3J41_14810 [Pantoea sp. Ap-870]|nr:hypothetical protein [Pantoea sp. Ap-870]